MGIWAGAVLGVEGTSDDVGHLRGRQVCGDCVGQAGALRPGSGLHLGRSPRGRQRPGLPPTPFPLCAPNHPINPASLVIAPRPGPCTLHPAPHTPHPAPCILHPAPCTLHPTLALYTTSFRPNLRGSFETFCSNKAPARDTQRTNHEQLHHITWCIREQCTQLEASLTRAQLALNPQRSYA